MIFFPNYNFKETKIKNKSIQWHSLTATTFLLLFKLPIYISSLFSMTIMSLIMYSNALSSSMTLSLTARTGSGNLLTEWSDVSGDALITSRTVWFINVSETSSYSPIDYTFSSVSVSLSSVDDSVKSTVGTWMLFIRLTFLILWWNFSKSKCCLCNNWVTKFFCAWSANTQFKYLWFGLAQK